MTPAPRRKTTLDGPGPLRLADAIDPPGDPRPEAKRGPTQPAGFEPMLGIDDLAALLSCSRRLIDRLRSAGKVPKPDIQIGRMPRWKAATIRAWIERGGKP